MKIPPERTRWYLHPLTILLSLPDVIIHKNRLTRVRCEGLKPPFILLCNHNAFMDFKVATRAIWPWRANYVVAIDGFIGREKLLRNVGCICKRKFTNDVTLISNLRETIKHGDVAVIYPEARYSLCGTTAVLPQSLGKFCKLFKVPVVTLICHGHHINSPFWNLHDRGVKPTEAELKVLFAADELAAASADEVNAAILEAFQYDEYRWQKENNIRITYKGRAEGLHKVLYQCPVCMEEFRMSSGDQMLSCDACGSSWELTELGELRMLKKGMPLQEVPDENRGATEFTRIPDWYEWERSNVRREVENGTYSSGELPVTVDTLPNADRFIRLGKGTMVHDMNGFTVRGTDVDGDPFEMVKPVPSLYSCHIEYEYLGKFGDCVDLNTLEDTWYIYPHDHLFAVTKMALATEELYYAYRRSIGRPCPKGFA